MAGEAPEYADWIRRQPCCFCYAQPPSVIHHRTGAGMALRDHDLCGMPLCWQCHTNFHALSGPFRGFKREHVRGWQDAMVQIHRRLYEAQGGVVDIPF